MSDSARDPHPEEINPAVWKNYPLTRREIIIEQFKGVKHYIGKYEDDHRILWTSCGIRLTNNLSPHPKTREHYEIFPDCYCKNTTTINCKECGL